MGIMSFLKKKPTATAEEQISYPKPQPEPDAFSFAAPTRALTDKELETWSQIFFDHSLLEEQFKNPSEATPDELFVAMKTLLKKNKRAQVKPCIEELIKAITTRLFKLYGDELAEEFVSEEADYDGFVLESDKVSFIPSYLSALYAICRHFELNFVEIFEAIKDIPIYNENYRDEIALDSRVAWSFEYFTAIFDMPVHSMLLDNIEKDECVHDIAYIFRDFFNELLENASSSDIERLHYFDVCFGEVSSLDAFDMLSDVLTNTSELETLRTTSTVLSIDAIDEIARLYPSLTVECYTYYLEYLLDVALDCEFDEQREFLSDLFCLTLDTITYLVKYRSEEFSDLKSSCQRILHSVMASLDGIALTSAVDFFKRTLKVKGFDFRFVVAEYFGDYLAYKGERIVLRPEDIVYLSRFLSNKYVFELISAERPAVIEVLS
jgi:hypothetical protein